MTQLYRNRLLRNIKKFYRFRFRHDKDLFLQIPKSSNIGIFSLFSNDLVCKYFSAHIDIDDFNFRRTIKALSTVMHRDNEGNFNPSTSRVRVVGIIGHHLHIAICDHSINLKLNTNKEINDNPIIKILEAYHEYLNPKPFQLTKLDIESTLLTKSQLQVTPKIKHHREIDHKHRYNYAKFRKR